MNYQVAPLWINSAKLACLIVISLFLAFFQLVGLLYTYWLSGWYGL